MQFSQVAVLMAALIAVAYAGTCQDACDLQSGDAKKACDEACDTGCDTCDIMSGVLKSTCEATYCGAGEVISSLFAVAAAAAFAMFN